MIFLQPLVIDPLFHKFEPLQTKDPGINRRTGKDGEACRTGHSAGTNVLDGRGRKDHHAERLCDGIWSLQANRGVGYDDRQNEYTPDRVRSRSRDGALRFGPYSERVLRSLP